LSSDGQAWDVVIVGFGPAGAVAACWLGQMGIRTLVLEQSRTIWEIPRAIALDHESLRVFQNIGALQRILPHTAPFGASEHYGVNGQLIRRIDVVQPPYPMGFLPNVVFTQPPLEAALRERAAEHASVAIRLGAEVTALAEESGAALVTLLAENGAAEQVRARYVIACDGAASTVRRLLRVPLEDMGFDEPWLVVDILVKDMVLAKLPTVCAQYCDPARPCTYIIGPGNHRRWEIMLNPGEDPSEMAREENVWPLLSRWLKPDDGRMWRASSYRFHALVAAQWRKGRIFLAGDAAHQQPPFLGQGMCQGIRDITNLCWKLSAVVGGACRESLLDTYESERHEHARTLIERVKEIGAAICIRDPEAARRRDEELLRSGGGAAPIVLRQEIVPPIVSGLVRSDRPATGIVFPQPRIATPNGPVLLDELAGHGWLLVLDGRATSEIPDLQDAALRAVVVGGNGLAEMDGVAALWFDSHSCVAAIVRPDHYVYCGLEHPVEAAAIWDALQHTIGREHRRHSRLTPPTGVQN
jgi:3-(3-hydroxy-phenyl)propionate hydroxylase